MLLRKLAIATIFVLVAQSTCAEDGSQQCTRPGFHFAVQPTVAVPLDLIAPHPTMIHDDGPLLLAPAIDARPAAPMPTPVRYYEVRVASNIEERPVPAAEKNAELERKRAQLNELQCQADALRAEIGDVSQILVKVKMLEVSLTKMRKMGFDINFFSGTQINAENISDIQKLGALDSRTQTKLASDGLAQIIDCLCQNQLAKVLTEPSIVVANGRPAEFCVGGEVPIRARGDSQAAVEFQKYGTEVSLCAFAIGEDRVRLNIRTRVSELDEAHKLSIGDAVVPAFSVRLMDTAIESKFGQSTVLCGGTENRTESIRRIGKDGKSETFEENNEVALLVIVTPESVSPIHPIENGATITK
jgi:Flp pilus assembly secretin CpaC